MNSLKTQTEFNAGRLPVVDPTGQPFTPGCRVRFRIPDYYVNTVSGTGTLIRIDEYGGSYLLSDMPLPVRDHNGSWIETRRERYTTVSRCRDGKRVTEGHLGNPHEHGTTRTFIEIGDV